ncbi:ATPase [uncultured Nocardioides sp.]|uniref:ATPase n=1 Tax=uncultured Nocardioides sp. TaxID=198441 RepID=UPI0026081BB8|nr:ATPase [uncultured Nocardioides sp.]
MTFTSDDDLDALDRIERSIDVDASPDRVWALVSVPGWWITEGDLVPNEVVDEGDGVHRVTHPTYGSFRIARVEARPPSYVAFRWLGGGAGETEEGPDTLVELFVDERPGGVTLRVVESGFTRGDGDRRRWLGHREENVTGWREVLDAARRRLASA